MSQQESNECFTYLACVAEDGSTEALVEMGCISNESGSHNLQTSNKPICRNNKQIQKKVDGVETQYTWQLEDLDETFRPINRFLRRAAKRCKVLRMFYLDGPITDPDVDGDVLTGAMSWTGQRNTGDKNAQITHENTGGVQCFDEYLAGGGNVDLGTYEDLPALLTTQVLKAAKVKKGEIAKALANQKSKETSNSGQAA